MSKQNYLQKRFDETVITTRHVFLQIDLYLVIEEVIEFSISIYLLNKFILIYIN